MRNSYKSSHSDDRQVIWFVHRKLWCSSRSLPMKNSGSARMCTSYRGLNPVSKKEQFSFIAYTLEVFGRADSFALLIELSLFASLNASKWLEKTVLYSVNSVRISDDAVQTCKRTLKVPADNEQIFVGIDAIQVLNPLESPYCAWPRPGWTFRKCRGGPLTRQKMMASDASN